MDEQSKTVINRILAFIVDYFFALACANFIWYFLSSILLGDPLLSDSRLELVFFVITSMTVPIAYFTLFEGFLGTTPGKKFYTLVVIYDNEDETEKEDAKILLIQAFLRNLTKIRIELVFIDLLLGNITKFPTSERLLSQLSKTQVIKGPDPQRSTQDQRAVNAFRLFFTLIALFFVGISLLYTYLDLLQ